MAAQPQTGATTRRNQFVPLAGRVRRRISLIAWVLVLLFAWIQLRDLKFGGVIEGTNPDLVRRITIAIYYLCWNRGCNFDLRLQEEAYFWDRSRLNIPKTATILLVAFTAIAAIMFEASKYDVYFAILLNVFLLINIVGFLYILWYIKPIIVVSKESYQKENQYFELLHLSFVDRYMNGAWQWGRFAAGAAVIVVLDLVCFNDQIRQVAAQNLAAMPRISASTQAVYNLIPSLLFVLFVAVMELWIWFMRLRVAIALDIIENISESYRIAPGDSNYTPRSQLRRARKRRRTPPDGSLEHAPQ